MTDESGQGQPLMVMFAGPNGSGKSTITTELRNAPGFPSKYINADDIAREKYGMVPNILGARDFMAANEADRQRKEALAKRESFAFETVMSTPGKMAIMDEAKAAGYRVEMVFVTTESAAINQTRVQARVQKGGHAVDFEKIAQRYERTMDLLPCAIDRADAVRVVDNSTTPKVVAEKANNTLTLFPGSPAWVQSRLGVVMQSRELSCETLANSARQVDPTAVVTPAAINAGKCYSGVIVAQTREHILQRLNTSNHFVLHDRRLAHPKQTLTEGKATAIAYRFGADGKHISPPVKLEKHRTHKI